MIWLAHIVTHHSSKACSLLVAFSRLSLSFQPGYSYCCSAPSRSIRTANPNVQEHSRCYSLCMYARLDLILCFNVRGTVVSLPLSPFLSLSRLNVTVMHVAPLADWIVASNQRHACLIYTTKPGQHSFTSGVLVLTLTASWAFDMAMFKAFCNRVLREGTACWCRPFAASWMVRAPDSCSFSLSSRCELKNFSWSVAFCSHISINLPC